MVVWEAGIEGGPRRVNHAAVCIGDYIISFGGYDSSDHLLPMARMDIHYLNIYSNRWFIYDMVDRRLIQMATISTDDIRAIQRKNINFYNDASPEIKRNIPDQRYGHTVVAYNKKAYLWGGRNDEQGACDNLFEFDPQTMEWQCLQCRGERPAARDGHTAVVIQDKMYIFGGFEEEAQRFSQEVYSYDFKTEVWTKMALKGKYPEWRDFHTAVHINNCIYIFGGRCDQLGQYHSTMDYYDNQVWRLNLATYEWSIAKSSDVEMDGKEEIIPQGRRSHSAWVWNGCMYIFGGYIGDTQQHSNELFQFNPETCRWRKVEFPGRAPTVRRRQCTVLAGDRMFLFGGTAPGPDSLLTDLDDLYILDFNPTLFTLCALKVLKNPHLKYLMSMNMIPPPIRAKFSSMTETNTPLPSKLKNAPHRS